MLEHALSHVFTSCDEVLTIYFDIAVHNIDTTTTYTTMHAHATQVMFI